MIDRNNPTAWGITKADFENNQKNWGTMMPTFRIQEKYLRRFQAIGLGIDNVFNQLAQIVIDAVVNVFPIMNRIPFNGLLSYDAVNVRKGVYRAMVHLIENNEIIQIIKAKSLSTPSFTLNQDVSPMVWAKDMLGMSAWNAFSAAGLQSYQVLTTDDDRDGDIIAFMELNGNIQYIGYHNTDKIFDWINSAEKEIK